VTGIRLGQARIAAELLDEQLAVPDAPNRVICPQMTG
jgi:hypothetical protein